METRLISNTLQPSAFSPLARAAAQEAWARRAERREAQARRRWRLLWGARGLIAAAGLLTLGALGFPGTVPTGLVMPVALPCALAALVLWWRSLVVAAALDSAQSVKPNAPAAPAPWTSDWDSPIDISQNPIYGFDDLPGDFWYISPRDEETSDRLGDH